VYRRKASGALVEPYLEYARSNRTRSRMNRMRRGRVRLAATNPRGAHFDLDRLFDELNGKYFEGRLQRPHIGWSARNWRRQFGCYDPGPNQILLNRRMDRPGVPACAVEYVLFHEMLHVKHPTRRSGCSMVSHSREFREEEKRFAEFERARRILDRLAR
jgi:predicted metal-dependent hydrolase